MSVSLVKLARSRIILGTLAMFLAFSKLIILSSEPTPGLRNVEPKLIGDFPRTLPIVVRLARSRVLKA